MQLIIRIHIYVYVCMYVCVYVCAYMCACACVCEKTLSYISVLENVFKTNIPTSDQPRISEAFIPLSLPAHDL